MKLHIGCSPLTARIYAGRINKAGDAWTSNQDVTGNACAAVVQHVEQRGGKIVVTENGAPWAEISVRMLAASEVPRG